MTDNQAIIDEVFDYTRGSVEPDLDYVAEKLNVDPANIEEALMEIGVEKYSNCSWWFETVGYTDDSGDPLCFDCALEPGYAD